MGHGQAFSGGLHSVSDQWSLMGGELVPSMLTLPHKSYNVFIPERTPCIFMPDQSLRDLALKHKMNRPLHFFRIFWIAACLLFPSSHCYGLADKFQHIHLWNQCLGLKDDKSINAFWDCFLFFSKQIDQTGDIAEVLRGYGYKCNHRLLMHWGFNLNDPFQHPSLSEDIALKIHMKEDGAPDIQVEAIRQYLIGEIKIRNSAMIAQVMATTGLPREQAAGLATIIYDIHILGDYVTDDIVPLARLDYLINQDFIRLGVMRLFHKAEDANTLVESLSFLVNTHVSPSEFEEADAQRELNALFKCIPDRMIRPDQNRALKMLILIKSLLPPLLDKHFGRNPLHDKGITIDY